MMETQKTCHKLCFNINTSEGNNSKTFKGLLTRKLFQNEGSEIKIHVHIYLCNPAQNSRVSVAHQISFHQIGWLIFIYFK